ncbi:MAG: hypothetical protein ABSH38_15125 [Verrucomicrobiota bacterium]|jgi:hypothetical protein
MEPRQRIAAILKQWLEKTHAEGEAIHAADLTALGKIQESKAELRAPLAEAIAQWRAKNPDEADTHPFRDEVNQLLALETHHSELLAARKRRAQEKKVLLEQALFNLRRVRSSYVQAPNRVFNKYS